MEWTSLSGRKWEKQYDDAADNRDSINKYDEKECVREGVELCQLLPNFLA